MTQNINSQTFRNVPLQCLLLVQSLSWIGGISLLGGGVALAQVPANEPTRSEAVPTQSIDLAQAQVTPVPAPVPVAPASLPREFSAPAPVVAPSQRRPGVATPAVPPAGSEGYAAPSAIVFSERSTGCRAVARSGQMPAGLCGGGSNGGAAVSRWAGTGLGTTPANISAVRVNGLGAGPTGLSIATTPTVRDFYRRTLRPPGRLGNGNIQLIFPLAIPAAISSVFGWRIHPISGEARFHTGTDLAAPLGTPVLAAFAGQVAIADFLGGYGLAVALNHTQDTQQTLYGHLSEIFVQPGEWVKQGEVIGRVGSTGNSTGPHLHFEFRQLTSDGWVALDAGAQLEYALAQLVNGLEFAQAPPQSARANVGIQGVIAQPTAAPSARSPQTPPVSLAQPGS